MKAIISWPRVDASPFDLSRPRLPLALFTYSNYAAIEEKNAARARSSVAIFYVCLSGSREV